VRCQIEREEVERLAVTATMSLVFLTATNLPRLQSNDPSQIAVKGPKGRQVEPRITEDLLRRCPRGQCGKLATRTKDDANRRSPERAVESPETTLICAI